MSPTFSPPAELRWLYVDFNSYFASVEQQMHPALRGKPVIVIPVETDSTCAIAASYEAKAYGVKTGTPVWEAKKKIPGLICVLGKHDQYRAFHDRILDEIDRHIPVEKVASIDEMACRLTKGQAAPAQATALARAIKAGIAANVGEYVRCSIGIAPNKYLAKVATDMQKPDGLTVLETPDIERRLLELQLRDLPGIGANMEQRLLRAQIRDMQDLLKLSPKHMRAVWGSLWGEKMWYYLRGYDLPEAETQRGSIGHSHVLSPEMRGPAEAGVITRRLLVKALARLRRMDYYATGLSVSARIENGPRIGFDLRCEAAQDNYSFLRLLDTVWPEMERELGARRFKKVGIVLAPVTPAQEALRQPDLFATLVPQETRKDRAQSDRISQAMDKLNKKFGKDTVMMGMTQDQTRNFTGTKIAFTRIPDMEEYLE